MRFFPPAFHHPGILLLPSQYQYCFTHECRGIWILLHQKFFFFLLKKVGVLTKQFVSYAVSFLS